MSRKTLAYGSQVLFTLALVVTLSLISGLAEARNPDLSYWTLNLSESAAPEEPARPDFAPEIAVVGNTVHVLWIRDNPGDYTLYYRRSIDGGKTWEAKQSLLTATDYGTFRYGNTLKRMAVEGDYVHIAYIYQDNLYYRRSTNNGASFEAPTSLYTAAALHDLYENYIAVSEGKVTICFQDNFWYSDITTNPRAWAIIFNSDNHGATFSRRGDAFDHSENGNGWNIYDLLRVGDQIYVLYTNSYYFNGMVYGRLYVSASSNAGASFTENKISVASSSGEDKTQTVQDNHYVPKLAGVGNNVSVIWAGLDADDVLSVFYRLSTDSGAHFSAAQNLSRDVIPAGLAIQPGQETLAAKGSYVYSAFLSSPSNVYFRRSIDSGASFLGLQELSYTPGHYAHGTSLAGGWWPVLALDPRDASGAAVQSSWTGGAYVYSTDAGATFTAPEQFLPRFALQSSSRPQMAIGPDGRPHFVTEADFYFPKNFGGYGDMDVFYRGLDPAPGPSGSNNALRLVSDYDTYRYDNLQVLPSSYLNFTSQMTGEVWVRPSPGGDYTGWSGAVIKPIFHKNETDYSSYSLQTWARGSARQARVQIQTTAGPFAINPSSASVGLVPDGVWSHLAFTYDAAGSADNLKLYLNGQLIASTTATGNLATGDGLFFSGLYGVWDVAELRLWNRALSQGEIAANRFKTLTGAETGLNAYYTFKNTTKDITGHGNDGLLMYQEQYIRADIPSTGAGVAADLLLLLD